MEICLEKMRFLCNQTLNLATKMPNPIDYYQKKESKMESKNFSGYTTLSIENALKELESRRDGLTLHEAENRIQHYGLNEII